MMQGVVQSLKAMIFENDYEIHFTKDQTELIKKPTYSAPLDITCTMRNNNSELLISKLIEEYNLGSMDNECKHILGQAKRLFFETFDEGDGLNIFIDKLIGLLIRTQDEGNNFNETEYFINQYIFLSDQTSEDIFKWLEGNQVESKYIFFLGFFYFSDIYFEKNDKEAFRLFLKATEDNDPIAQVYLAKCYKEGLGTEGNDELALHWVQKAVENGSICGRLDLGG